MAITRIILNCAERLVGKTIPFNFCPLTQTSLFGNTVSPRLEKDLADIGIIVLG